MKLRRLEREDVEFLFRESTGNIRTFFEPFDSQEQADAWVVDALKKIERNEKEEWVGVIDGVPVGMIGINHFENEARIGLWVAESRQGKGIGKELLSEFIMLVKQRGEPEELYYYADFDNIASNKLAVACGFSLLSSDSDGDSKYVLRLKV